jgi:hypothetical protein
LALDLSALLVAHSYLVVERPPLLWTVDGEDVTIIPMLGEMIAAALGGGSELGAITLRVSNVTVDSVDGPVPDGDYVAVTILAGGDWSVPEHWWPAESTVLHNVDLDRAARASPVVYGYTQARLGESSVTVFLPRAKAGPTR